MEVELNGLGLRACQCFGFSFRRLLEWAARGLGFPEILEISATKPSLHAKYHYAERHKDRQREGCKLHQHGGGRRYD